MDTSYKGPGLAQVASMARRPFQTFQHIPAFDQEATVDDAASNDGKHSVEEDSDAEPLTGMRRRAKKRPCFSAKTSPESFIDDQREQQTSGAGSTYSPTEHSILDTTDESPRRHRAMVRLPYAGPWPPSVLEPTALSENLFEVDRRLSQSSPLGLTLASVDARTDQDQNLSSEASMQDWGSTADVQSIECTKCKATKLGYFYFSTCSNWAPNFKCITCNGHQSIMRRMAARVAPVDEPISDTERLKLFTVHAMTYLDDWAKQVRSRCGRMLAVEDINELLQHFTNEFHQKKGRASHANAKGQNKSKPRIKSTQALQDFRANSRLGMAASPTTSAYEGNPPGPATEAELEAEPNSAQSAPDGNEITLNTAVAHEESHITRETADRSATINSEAQVGTSERSSRSEHPDTEPSPIIHCRSLSAASKDTEHCSAIRTSSSNANRMAQPSLIQSIDDSKEEPLSKFSKRVEKINQARAKLNEAVDKIMAGVLESLDKIEEQYSEMAKTMSQTAESFPR